LQEAFHYLFTSRDGHWNCSNRSGGYQVLPNGVDKGEINRIFREISRLDYNGVVREAGNVKITRTVMMHLVWPYVFPFWYKETRGGYSQIRGMTRLLSDVAYHSNDAIRKKDGIDLYGNYAHYASVYRLLLLLYKTWVANQGGEPHFDFFTQFLADLIPTANRWICFKLERP
jgi:hypothetical protein